MPYSARSRSTWTGWEEYSTNLKSGGPSDWTYWGYYRLVEVSGKPVLLFKSNTHLDWPGAAYLEALIQQLVADAQPGLILSIGTAGGAKPQDHIGTVRAVSAGTLYEAAQPPAGWPEYKNPWKASDQVLGTPNSSSFYFRRRPGQPTFKRSARNSTASTARVTRCRNWIRTVWPLATFGRKSMIRPAEALRS